MSTVTLTAPNGAKVRTVHSKLLFVVSYGEYGRPVAHVEKRTDSYASAYATLRKQGVNTIVVRVTVKDGEYVREILDPAVLRHRAEREKAQKAAEKKAASRSLWY